MRVFFRYLILGIAGAAMVGCSGGTDTSMTKEEQTNFGGHKPPDDVLKKLQQQAPTPNIPAKPPK